MLKIFNDLRPFFEDSYKRIHVREYARIQKINPPSPSTLLKELKEEGLLIKEEDKNYLCYYANRENQIFIMLSRAYWYTQLKNIGLIGSIEKELILPVILVFGSFSKAEISQKSDIDIAIFNASKKPNIEKFQKALNREIQLFIFKDRKDVKNKELLNSILNGFIISGGW